MRIFHFPRGSPFFPLLILIYFWVLRYNIKTTTKIGLQALIQLAFQPFYFPFLSRYTFLGETQEDSKEYKYSLLSSHINSLLLETSGFTGSFYTTFLFLNRIIGNYASFSRIRRIMSLFSFCPVLSYSYLFILMISSVQSRQSIAFYLLFANIGVIFPKELPFWFQYLSLRLRLGKIRIFS